MKLTKSKLEKIHHFAKHCIHELGIKGHIKIHLSTKPTGMPTAGYYNPEDDKKILCLMVDEKEVNYSDKIPFIRTLFKTGRHYEYQLVRRDELLFKNKRTDETIDYYDCDF